MKSTSPGLHLLDEGEALYAPNARFKAPFNDVHGGPAIATIFRHMKSCPLVGGLTRWLKRRANDKVL
ncbi:hypothetical protein [Rhodoferax sp.]|uniref:hypothetical protein n=1 Tax=Rhodoferax sp. TaxID=50421 RepID=UPI003BB73086|nr:hypothetical protein [Rhodoferax sp.]